MSRSIHAALIGEVASTYRLPAVTLEAMVLVESSDDPYAFRYEPEFFHHYVRYNDQAKGFRYGPLAACSYGLLQVMLETALEAGFDGQPQELFSPRVGLAWGAKHLAALYWGWADADIDRAVAAYNGGTRGNVSRPFRNQVYLDRVTAAAALVTEARNA